MQNGVKGPYKVETKATTRSGGKTQWQVIEVRFPIVEHHKFNSEEAAVAFIESKS